MRELQREKVRKKVTKSKKGKKVTKTECNGKKEDKRKRIMKCR